jgi:hypothetical protein
MGKIYKMGPLVLHMLLSVQCNVGTLIRAGSRLQAGPYSQAGAPDLIVLLDPGASIRGFTII